MAWPFRTSKRWLRNTVFGIVLLGFLNLCGGPKIDSNSLRIVLTGHFKMVDIIRFSTESHEKSQRMGKSIASTLTRRTSVRARLGSTVQSELMDYLALIVMARVRPILRETWYLMITGRCPRSTR